MMKIKWKKEEKSKHKVMKERNENKKNWKKKK